MATQPDIKPDDNLSRMTEGGEGSRFSVKSLMIMLLCVLVGSALVYLAVHIVQHLQ